MDQELKEKCFAWLKPVLQAARGVWGSQCEVVLHDLADPGASIVWIEGDLTHRKPGDPLTDLGLSYLRAGDTEGLHSYGNILERGRTLRSCSVFLSDEGGEVFAAVCVNLDITPYLALERHLHSVLDMEPMQAKQEVFARDAGEVLDHLLEDAIGNTGIPVSLMQRADRLRVMGQLDNRGAFLLRGAVPHVAERFGVSRNTIYNDLAQIAKGGEKGGADRREEETTPK